ncbi:MAG: DNA adenine methylase [Phycisphaerae bacterium]|nr:DNA adenine methylase [Phycisphaerae bacterium]
MPIKALAPWFGGKRNLAPLIVAELGPHRCYWEPFCGSMAVLLAKPPATMETVNDLHAGLINLARVVRDSKAGAQLYRRLRRTWMSEDLFREADDFCRAAERFGSYSSPRLDEQAVNRAYCYFLVSWLGRNGSSGIAMNSKGTFCVRYTAKGGHAAKRFHSAIDSIPAWRRRMRKVAILNRDGFDLLERIEDAPGTAIYVDPPYLVKGTNYLHDFAEADHARLAALLARFSKARVVISYYDHPLLAELYPGWTVVRIPVSRALAHGGKRGANQSRAVECLLLNGPSYTQAADAPLLAGQTESL